MKHLPILLALTLAACALETEEAPKVVAHTEGLFGLSSFFCPVTRQCITTQIKNLNTQGGSDLNNKPAHAMLRAALFVRLQGEGEFWMDGQEKRSGYARACQPDCADADDIATLGPTTWTADGRYRQATAVMGPFKYRLWHAPDQWSFAMETCTSDKRLQPVTIAFFGARGSQDLVQVCWGGYKGD
jgi:hypothetical protein